MSVTLKQIARHVGVSQPLVTYALNGKPGVSEVMRQKILDAATEMGYSPHANRAAKVLIARRHGTKVRTGVLALLLPPMGHGGNSVQENPFFLPYFCGVEIEAARRDYNLFVCAMRGGELPSLIDSGGVDGVLGVGVPSAFSLLKERGIPALALGFQERGIPSLVPDDAGGIHQAVAHLAHLGHRHIAYLGFSGEAFITARARLQAFHEAMLQSGLKVDEKLIAADSVVMEEKAAADLLDGLLKRSKSFTAIVCYNDIYAMGAVKRLQELGRKVPDDIAVVGFDGYATQIGFSPLLTSVNFDRQKMAEHAVGILCRALDQDESTLKTKTESFPVQLVQGETS